MMMNASERRKHEREELTIVFNILDGTPELKGQNRGTILNLSEGGAAFESDAFLQKGQNLFFELPLPVRVWAKVLRVQEGVRNRYGVKFERVRLSEKKLLKALMAREKAGRKSK